MTQNTTQRIAIAGASGRMGHMLIEAIRAADDCELTGALDIATSPALGTDAMAFLGQTSAVSITDEMAVKSSTSWNTAGHPVVSARTYRISRKVM